MGRAYLTATFLPLSSPGIQLGIDFTIRSASFANTKEVVGHCSLKRHRTTPNTSEILPFASIMNCTTAG